LFASSPEGRAFGKGVKFLLYTGQLVRAIPSAFARASPFGRGGTALAVTERVTLNPLRLTSFASSPEGRALGKGVKFLLYTGRLMRAIPSAFARASPFGRGGTALAVTERVTLNPLRLTPFASSPEGRAFGKGVKFLHYTGQLVRTGPSAFARASPSRGRWHRRRR